MELCVFLAFLTTFLLCIVLRPLAFRLNLIDHPDERRLHSHPAQLTGGMSIVISMLLIMLFANHMGLIQKTNLLPSLFLMMMLGLLDDLYRLKFHQIITLQIFIGLVMIFNGGYHVEHLGKLLGEFDLKKYSSQPLGICC